MIILTESFLKELMNLRRKAELDPKGFKKLKDKYTHGIPCSLDTEVQRRMDSIFKEGLEKYGKYTWEFQSFLKVGVGIEFDSKEVAKIYKERNEIPPAYDLSIRGFCLDEEITDIMNSILMRGDIPDKYHNTKGFINRAKELRERYESLPLRKNRVGKLRNGSATRIKGAYNIVDITGVVFHNENYKPPINILNRLHVERCEDWDSLDWTEHLKQCHGQHFVVPGKECKEIREVYVMDPEEQLDGSEIAKYLRFIAKGFDTNATTDQMKWVRKCIKEDWNNTRFIISTDMEKYSDSLNRYKLLLILKVCNVIEENEIDELDRFWGSDVWDRDKRVILSGSDSVKQGQYGIFDAMTIANMFLQCVIYDILKEDCQYSDISEKGKRVIRNNNSALGDDTVLSFLNEHPEGLTVIKNVFGYMGVNISNSKTHIMCRGFNYVNGRQTDEPGFIDFAKRVITKDGLIPYISANAISKNNFDDHVLEYFRILEESKELAEAYGRMFLKDKFPFIKNLHRINGGRREDKITDDDMIYFEYRMNKILSLKSVSRSELLKQLKYIKSQGILLSNTKLLGWLPEHDSDSIYLPSESKDQKIIAEILNYRDYGRDINFIPSDYIGKTWNEVKEDPIITEITSTIRINEMEIARRKDIPSHVYRDLSELDLSECNHSWFIWDFSIRNESGYRDYDDMRNEAFIKKIHRTFSRCVSEFHKHYNSRITLRIGYDICWENIRYFLIYGDREFRLYDLKIVRENSRPLIPFTLFCFICKGAFPNKDMKFVYDSFISSLPGLGADYYSFFDDE